MGEAVDHGGLGVRVLGGPIALERGLRSAIADLRDELCRAQTGGASLASLLDEPSWIVVPSASLREHLCAALVADGAVLGLRILTLEGLARDVLARVGDLCVDSPLHAVAVRRLARAEPPLAAALEGYEDGYQVVADAVDDLLDAGLEPAHAEFLLERVHELPGRTTPSRIAAVVRVATRLAAAQGGVACHRAERLARARRAIEADPEAALPARRILIAGFQDATGVQTDLLETLVRVRGAEVLFELPADPAVGSGSGDFGSFGERLRTRLGGAAGFEPGPDEPEPPPDIEVVRAPDREAEVRHTAARLRALLDAGSTPERVGVVVRDVAPYRAALRRQLARMSVPFSGCGEPGLAGPTRVRLDALQRLLDRRERSGVEAWLDARVDTAEGAVSDAQALRASASLRRALHRCGCVQLRDLVRLPAGAGPLAGARRQAGRLVDALGALQTERSLGGHTALLQVVVRDLLGWTAQSPAAEALAELDAVLASPGFVAVAQESLGFDEFSGLLRRALSGAGRGSLGGRGAGVQVLGVMEARSRSFDTLFVLGLNRGLFPRPVTEDSFLPDPLRARLRDVLPELPVKAEGHDEERFLFAQLLAAAPRLVLSSAAADEEGSPLAASPLLERLVNAGVTESDCQAPPLHAPLPLEVPRPAREHALLAGLQAGLEAQEPLLPVALDPVDLASAAARTRVLRELDAYRGPGGELGPYFGFVGPRHDSEAPFVTLLEATLRCPWSAYLGRILKLAPAPDALDALPRVDTEQRLLGNVVHGALDRLVGAQLPESSRAGGGAGHAVVWPEPEHVSRALLEAAEEALERAEVSVPGYARVLARRAAPYVEVVRELDWSSGAVQVLGVEHEGRAALSLGADATREVRFRADRVDSVEGRLRFTDYKTGRPRLPRRDDPAKLLDALARRQQLQAVVYAASEPQAQGRYLFLRPDDGDDPRERCVTLEDGVLPEALERAAAIAFQVLDSGAFVPRLRVAGEDKEPAACRRCDVKEACLRGDSGARGRLARFMDGRDPGQGSAALQAATALWQLEVDR